MRINVKEQNNQGCTTGNDTFRVVCDAAKKKEPVDYLNRAELPDYPNMTEPVDEPKIQQNQLTISTS